MSSNFIARPPSVMLGAGGHAKVLLSLTRLAHLTLAGVCDPVFESQPATQWRGVPVLGGDTALDALDPAAVELINAVGQTAGSGRRQALFDKMLSRGFKFATLAHPAATIDPTVVLGHGAQVMAGAILQADCQIGDNTIINTRCSVDHDCIVGAHVHIAPGATLCGGVRVHEAAFIGAGATIVPGVNVGAHAMVTAGSVLTRDLAASMRWPSHSGHKQAASDDPQGNL